MWSRLDEALRSGQGPVRSDVQAPLEGTPTKPKDTPTKTKDTPTKAVETATKTKDTPTTPIKSTPQRLIAQGTDWRFLNELKRELKA